MTTQEAIDEVEVYLLVKYIDERRRLNAGR